MLVMVVMMNTMVANGDKDEMVIAKFGDFERLPISVFMTLVPMRERTNQKHKAELEKKKEHEEKEMELEEEKAKEEDKLKEEDEERSRRRHW